MNCSNTQSRDAVATEELFENCKKTEWCCTLFQMRSPTVTSRLLLQFPGCWRLSRGVYTGTGPRPPDPKAAAIEGGTRFNGTLKSAILSCHAILTAKKVLAAFIII